jgi:processive 1,2-diacylglycerol beta-glucosyltransferase
MSGSEGSGIIRAVVRVLLKRTDVHVNVICGRNKKLRKKLKKEFAEHYHGRLSVMGFVEDIQNVMIASDVLVMRASPNTAMEAVALNVPVILFGQLAGQEQHNPDLLQAHGLAKYCSVPEALPDCVRAMFADDGAEIRAMRAAQRAYAPVDSAAETAKLLDGFIKPLEK